MVRVCLVGLIAGGRSGVPRYAAALTSALDRVAPEFPDLSMHLLTNPSGVRAVNARNIGAEALDGPLARAATGPRRILSEHLHARDAEADLLHFFDLGGPVLARNRQFVTTIHDAATSHGFEPVRMAHKRLLQPWAARRATAAVAVSAFAKDEAVRRFGADPARVHVIHSGPGLVTGEDVALPASDPPYLLYVGNLAAHKNLPFLVEAFRASGVDGRLVLAGSRGERFEEVRRAVEASPVRDRIEIRRDVSDADLNRLYRGASMLLLPSRYEGFGFTALEAMSRDCPVVASDIPALREVSGNGALLVPVDDGSAWAEAIRRVMSEHSLQQGLRRRGRETVGRYSWEETARRISELFVRVG